jgi:hypothetical protein
MKRSASRNTPALIIATGALLVGATGGAVAAGLITGADIKDGTVTTKDIKNETLALSDISAAAEAALKGSAGAPGADGVSGWVMVTVTSESVPAGVSGTTVVDCPAGKKVTGGIVDWSEGYDPVSMRARSDSSIRAYGKNTTGPADTLVATIFCVTAP